MAEQLDPKVKFIFDTMDATRVSVTDMSKITGVSRMSLHRWKNGGPIKDILRKEIVYRTAQRLQKAFDLEELPLVDRYKAPKRVEVLRKIVKKMATAKK